MKSTLQLRGSVELEQSDIFNILVSKGNINRKDFTLWATEYLLEKTGHRPVRIQYGSEGLDKVVAVFDSKIDEGASPLGRVTTGNTKGTPVSGFSRKWRGLYDAIAEVVQEQRSRKKHFISWEDLMAELLDMEDQKGKKLFVQNGEELPLSVVKHRVTRSQILRQAKNTPGLRGVLRDNDKGGLKF